MPRKRVITADSLKRELDKIKRELRAGKLDNKTATTLATLTGKQLYAIQIENQQASQRAEELLELVAEAMYSGDTKALQRYLAEVKDEGGG